MIGEQPERQQAALAGLVRALRAWGVGGVAAELLENSGPLGFLGAQALYFAAPVLDPFASAHSLVGWAELLEDPEAVSRLAGQLRAPTATPEAQP
jgi:hypothetical protein